MAGRKRQMKADGKLEPMGYATGAIVPPTSSKKKKVSAPKREEKGTASHCLEEIRRYEKKFEAWDKRAKQIVDRYRDERDKAVVNSSRAFNVLWSNVQVLKPTLYAHAPKAEVVRRFKDQDKVGRISCEIAERATDVEIEFSDLDSVLQACVLDRLLPGRGQAWVSYNPTLKGEGEDRAKTDDGVNVEYIDAKDFGHSAVSKWKQVTKVWRWKWFTKEEATEAFGSVASELDYGDKKDDKREEDDEASDAVTRVAEVWDKDTGYVYWVSKSHKDYLDEYPAPLNLAGFFPCPQPLYATMTNGTLVPVPDFYLYQDQANEVDKLTGRINRLTDALKVVGAYDENFNQLEDILDPRGVEDNTLVPVNMSDLTGKGGLSQAIQLVDISMVIQTIEACYIARERALQVIHQITGIADILRGSTDPNETLGAQQLKAQFGGTRIRDMQQEVARFARDIVRIMAEIIVENYEPQKLWEMTNAISYVGMMPPAPPQPGMPPEPPQPNVQAFAEALKLLKDDRLRSYRVDIETDSTIALDEAQSKEEAVEFMKVMGETLTAALPLAAQAPAAIPFIKESIGFVARRFKAGRGLENALEQMTEGLQQQAQQPKQDPAMIKAQADLQKAQAQIRLVEVKAQAATAQGQQKIQLEREKAALEAQVRMFEAQQEAQFRQMEFEQERAQDAATHAQNLAQDREAAAQKAQELRNRPAANQRAL